MRSPNAGSGNTQLQEHLRFHKAREAFDYDWTRTEQKWPDHFGNHCRVAHYDSSIDLNHRNETGNVAAIVKTRRIRLRQDSNLQPSAPDEKR